MQVIHPSIVISKRQNEKKKKTQCNFVAPATTCMVWNTRTQLISVMITKQQRQFNTHR